MTTIIETVIVETESKYPELDEDAIRLLAGIELLLDVEAAEKDQFYATNEVRHLVARVAEKLS